MGDEQRNIRGFGDAVGIIKALHAQFGHAHAVALVAEDGTMVEFVSFTAPTCTIDSAIGWAECRTLELPAARRVIFFSCGDGGTSEPRERDIRTAEDARSAFADAGYEVLDWLLVDGEQMRSMAVTAGWGTWDATHASRYDDER